MGKVCTFCGIEHSELLDSVTDKATEIAEKFTEKSFPKIWSIGMGKLITAPMSREQLAEFMFETGATQMLTEYLMNEYEDRCKNKK